MANKILTAILWSCFCMLCMPASGQKMVAPARDILDISGNWKLFLDAKNMGIAENISDSMLRDSVRLPGTLEENGKGKRVEIAVASYLNQSWQYIGAAWYQKEIEVPESWRDKHLQLFLERTKVTEVWLDGKKIGQSTLLSAPQVYQLKDVVLPGKHRLLICVNNSPNLMAVGGSHALSEHTQTNWNGIVGKMHLVALPQLRISHLKIKPDAQQRIVYVELSVSNQVKQNVVLKIGASSWNSKNSHLVKPLEWKLRLNDSDTILRFVYPMGPEANLWSEYHPAMYQLKLSLLQNKKLIDTVSTNFGLRDFKASGTQFKINEVVTFLRGKNDGCIFPLTGYPPMDVAAWRKLYQTAKLYGINHYRFHSYTPPEAAFDAADIEGIYIQSELPNWANFSLKDTVRTNFQYKEAKAILNAFGNHPSFVMFSLGNELGGEAVVHHTMVKALKHEDGRVLYAQGTNAFYNEPKPGPYDDFWVTMRSGKEDKKGYYDVRGSFATTEDGGNGILNTLVPSTRRNFSTAIKGFGLPIIGHETGQYQSYPDYREIPKYTGILRPLNLSIFKDRLEKKGMATQAADFFRASGMFSALLYREEIEMALRTPGFGGFQLLDLQDYPGQGTALVGLFNAFMESKGLISAEAFRSFNSDVVLQLLMDKYTWSNNETYTADVQLVNYSPHHLSNQWIKWSIVNSLDNGVFASGEFRLPQAPNGGVVLAGKIDFPLLKITTAQKLMVKLEMPDTGRQIEYPVWVYPANCNVDVPANVSIATRIDDELIAKLDQGRSVLIFPEHDLLKDKSVGPQFITEFWNWLVFKNAALNAKRPVSAGTLGILTNPKHPLFNAFPTEFYSNWQWWLLTKNARPLILDNTAKGYTPIVQVIDNIDRNHKLGMIFEFKTGKGKLLVSMVNLLPLLDKPEARQLYHSMLNYVSSDQFQPTEQLSPDQLRKLL